MPGDADPFRPAPLRLIDGEPPAGRRIVDLALGVLGATTATTATTAGRATSGVVLRAGLDAGAALAADDEDRPVLIVPAAPGPQAAAAAAAAFTELTGVELRLREPAWSRAYGFADTPVLWPFSGLDLDEDEDRLLPAAMPVSGVDTLVFTPRGGVVVHTAAGGRSVTLSLVPLPDDVRLLKDEFGAGRFAGLLPLLVFARSALGDAGWRTPHVGACILVDDPNLRRRRYGFLDLDRVLEAARREDFHLAIAMIPLDYAKTRAPPAALVGDNPDRLSLVLHGVDHRRLEFEADVGRRRAESAVAQALARMDAHRRRTGIPYPRVMTFPHGGCNPTWLGALRTAGFDAALASRAVPFAHESGLGDPAYEMHPAELGFAGFPMVNRFKAEEPVEHLLFQAWLGKPLVVYTHHEFFGDGLDRVTAIVRYLNRHVRPRWSDIGTIVAANLQVRETPAGPALRVFSNRVSVPLDRGLAGVMKPIPQGGREPERAHLDDVELALEPTAQGLAAYGIAARPGAAEIAFTPARRARPEALAAVSLRSRARRGATELRDQAIPVAAGLRSLVRARS